MTSYKIEASEPYWVDVSIDYLNGSPEEGLPERDTPVHDLTGVYKVVTLWDGEEVCTLHDREMAEAILVDLQEGRISEREAVKIAGSKFSWFLYSVRLNLRILFQFLG